MSTKNAKHLDDSLQLQKEGIYCNGAALTALREGVDWVHIVRDIPRKDWFEEVKTYLASVAVKGRGCRDVLMARYTEECRQLVDESAFPVVLYRPGQAYVNVCLSIIRNGLLARIPGSAISRLLRDPTAVALCTALGKFQWSRLIVWGRPEYLPLLRRAYPEETIALSQHQFDYDPGIAHYDKIDSLITLTRGAIRHAFSQYRIMRPFPVAIPNGIDLSKFSVPTPEDKRALQVRYGVPDGCVTVLFPSKLALNKGSRILEKWILRAKAERKNWHFIVSGPTHETLPRRDASRLTEILTNAGNVTWLGGIDRASVSEVTSAADISLMPVVWREGFGLVTAEAFACGVPVIGSDGGANRELIHEGYNGSLCPQDDLFASGFRRIEELSENRTERQRLGRNGRIYAESRLSLERYVSNYRSFLADEYENIDNSLEIPV